MIVEYLGRRMRRTVLFPIPFTQHSEKEGEVIFSGHGDVQEVPEKWAAVLVSEFPDLFRRVEGADDPEASIPAIVRMPEGVEEEAGAPKAPEPDADAPTPESDPDHDPESEVDSEPSKGKKGKKGRK